jgi:Raf kinase inhibitor-like YbhB/YbcL family protein
MEKMTRPVKKALDFRIVSPAFQAGEKVPQKYTCDGKDVSPPLSWYEPPAGTQSFALISDDPDAPGGTWVHWVIYDLPAGKTGLPEGIPKTETLPDGSKQGVTDFQSIGYGGPCPPAGKPHRYFFKLYALNSNLVLPPKAAKTDLLKAMEGRVLAQAELIGLYQRASG